MRKDHTIAARTLSRVKLPTMVVTILALLLTLIPTQTIEASPSQLSGCNALMAQGSRGPCVIYLQEALNLYGYNLTPDGIFGPLTGKAVRAFQASRGLRQDGLVGPATRAALLDLHSVPTPKPRGPRYSTICNGGECTVYLSRNATTDLAEFLNSRGGIASVGGGDIVACGVIGLATGGWGGLICGVVLLGVEVYGAGQVNDAAKKGACISVRFNRYTGALYGLWIVQRHSQGNQFCHD